MVIALCSAARANPIDAFGFGSRAQAMGGAVTADSEDASANYYNPAGLVRGHDLRIDLGYRYAQPILKMNGRDVGVDASRGFALGIVAPGKDRRLPLRLRRRALAARSAAHPGALASFSGAALRLLRQPHAAAVAVGEFGGADRAGLYIGAGLTFMSRTTGQVNLMGDIAVSDPDASTLITDINVDLVAVRYPEAGILWDVTRNLSLAACYRDAFSLKLDQGFRIDGNVGKPGRRRWSRAAIFRRAPSRPICFSRGSSRAVRARG